jgi:hypothetical protein
MEDLKKRVTALENARNGPTSLPKSEPSVKE